MNRVENSRQTADDATSIEGVQKVMLQSLDLLRSKLETKTTNGTVLAVLQGTPCLAKCAADIKSPTYGDNVDQYYLAKHDYARVSMVDRIAQDFSNGKIIGVEQVTSVGKLDVGIADRKILVSNGNKTIGIEIKSGKGGVDLFQLVRYLFEVDKLLVARVATADVAIIERSDIANQLNVISTSLQRKVDQIIEGHQYKVQGPWCYECNIECEYRRNRSTSHHVAKMEGLADFINNVGVTVEKTLSILKEELAS
jgi:hypothetical protein